jgi:hypothetical protein
MSIFIRNKTRPLDVVSLLSSFFFDAEWQHIKFLETVFFFSLLARGKTFFSTDDEREIINHKEKERERVVDCKRWWEVKEGK